MATVTHDQLPYLLHGLFELGSILRQPEDTFQTLFLICPIIIVATEFVHDFLHLLQFFLFLCVVRRHVQLAMTTHNLEDILHICSVHRLVLLDRCANSSRSGILHLFSLLLRVNPLKRIH